VQAILLSKALRRFFEEKLALAAAAGLSPEAVILDPGIDFAKQREDNLTVFRELGRLRKFGRPVLVPVSRKSVIGEVLDLPDPSARGAGRRLNPGDSGGIPIKFSEHSRPRGRLNPERKSGLVLS
jgi:dihydropteroate synthase